MEFDVDSSKTLLLHPKQGRQPIPVLPPQSSNSKIHVRLISKFALHGMVSSLLGFLHWRNYLMTSRFSRTFLEELHRNYFLYGIYHLWNLFSVLPKWWRWKSLNKTRYFVIQSSRTNWDIASLKNNRTVLPKLKTYWSNTTNGST